MTTDTETGTDHRDPDERLPLPHFTAGLWDELAQLHEHRRVTEAAAAARTGDARASSARTPLDQRQRRHRQRGRRSIYVGAGAVAAAIAAVVAVSIAQPNDPNRADERDAAVPPVDDDAVRLGTMIVAATDRAAEETVVHSVSDEIDPDAADGEMDQLDEEAWVDWSAPGANVRRVWRDQEGTVVSESAGTFGTSADEGLTPSRSFDHVHHTFSDGCSSQNGVFASGEDIAAMISRELAKGHYVQDGTEVVDGEELIVVRIRSGIGESGEWESSSRSALYVDPDTHLLVRNRIYDEDGHLDVDDTIEYLPRTPANLALTTVPPVPAGYTRVEPPTSAC